jgi:uroporphyrin-III C-methyltransferase/precorrin-2 dehydrogenase/sirohydrochlorin ferrochelatase
MEPLAKWPYFPVFLRLRGRRVLVVGGGEVAARKLRLLAKTEAQLDVVARELNEELSQAHGAGALRHLAEEFAESQLDGCVLVIAATDDSALNRRIAAAADAREIAVNVVDDPVASSFVTPSIVDRHPLLIAIATGAQAPVLGRRLREKLETLLPSAYGRLADFMGARRARVQQAVPQADRRGLWESFLDGPGAEAIFSGAEAAADAELQHLIDGGARRGEVYLVGAGPGDPDLLSFRALRLMQQCDVVLYDALLPQAILDLVRRDAERIYVGKRRARHTLAQDQINSELVRLAREGKRVLRLKGGDPFVFGRGGEEIQQLAAAGIPFQVVPGITAANGCAAYAGIPLTHRDYAQACIFVTGHQRQDGTLDLHWDALARRGQTVVIYMGLNTLPNLCAKLVEHGLPADWPAAVVEQGTSPDQRVVVSTLSGLAEAVGERRIGGPSLVIVGEVVRLRDQLQWFAGKG